MNKELEESIEYKVENDEDFNMQEIKYLLENHIHIKFYEANVIEILHRSILNYIDNSISKEVIEKEIKELDEELEQMKVDNMYVRYKKYGGKSKWEKLFTHKYGMHDILQELLEEK